MAITKKVKSKKLLEPVSNKTDKIIIGGDFNLFVDLWYDIREMNKILLGQHYYVIIRNSWHMFMQTH